MFVTLLAILLLHPGVAVLVLLQARLAGEALPTGLALPRAGDPLVYAPNVRLQRVCFLKLLVAGRALQPGRNVVSGDDLTDLTGINLHIPTALLLSCSHLISLTSDLIPVPSAPAPPPPCPAPTCRSAPPRSYRARHVASPTVGPRRGSRGRPALPPPPRLQNRTAQKIITRRIWGFLHHHNLYHESCLAYDVYEHTGNGHQSVRLGRDVADVAAGGDVSQAGAQRRQHVVPYSHSRAHPQHLTV